jgi:hypothetical protein
MWNLVFFLFGDSVSVGAWFVPSVTKARKSFWTHTMELLGNVGHVESHSGVFGDTVSVAA